MREIPSGFPRGPDDLSGEIRPVAGTPSQRPRSQRSRGPVTFPKDPYFFAWGSTHTLRGISKSRVGETVAKNRRRSSRFETNHEWMKRKGPTLKRSDATNGRAIVKNSDCGPYEAEDNVQREIPLNHKGRMVGLENGLRIQQILARHRVRRIRNEGIK